MSHLPTITVLERPVIAFTKVKAPYGWLSNMSPHPLLYPIDDTEWRTAEALFQAMRFKSKKIREQIRAQKSPMAAKMVAKSNAIFQTVEPTSPRDLENMEIVLRLKLQQHPDLKAMLLGTGDAFIIEDVSSRQRGSSLIWGMAWRDDRWVGCNALGNIWMRIRDGFRS